MRRLFCVVAVLAVMMLPAYAAGQDKPAAKAAPAAKMLSASGSVTAVAQDSITIKAKSGEMTFAVDSKTKVTGPGAGTKTEEKKKLGQPTVLTDFVKTGEMVTVQYHDLDGTKHAANIKLMRPKTAAK
jgi:hypothetical protein